MGRLNELIQLLKETDITEYGEGLTDDIVSARDEDDSVYAAKIESLEENNNALLTQISTLKNELYDLTKLVTATDTEETESSEDNEDDETDVDIDDFFTEGEN